MSAPSGGWEPPGARWKDGGRRRGSRLGTGPTPIDSAGLKVRRDKRTGPDGAEEPLAATAYKGGREHGPDLVLSRGIRRCPRQRGKDERGVRVHVRRVRRLSSERLHLRFETVLLLPPRLPDRSTPRGVQLLVPVLSRFYNGNWAHTFCAAYTEKSNSMVTARANCMSINDATNIFLLLP